MPTMESDHGARDKRGKPSHVSGKDNVVEAALVAIPAVVKGAPDDGTRLMRHEYRCERQPEWAYPMQCRAARVRKVIGVQDGAMEKATAVEVIEPFRSCVKHRDRDDPDACELVRELRG